jgi:hypothetical protein
MSSHHHNHQNQEETSYPSSQDHRPANNNKNNNNNNYGAIREDDETLAYASQPIDTNREGHRFNVPPVGPLWPNGLALQEREDPADECSCPDWPSVCPCCAACCGFPLYFATSSTSNALVSSASVVQYPWCYLPGCRPAWWIDRADVNGVPIRFEGWDCKGSCCGPAIRVFDLPQQGGGNQQEEDKKGRFIGQADMRCQLCSCCGEVELARITDAEDNVILRRFGRVCCGTVINSVIDHSCCSCYSSYRWGVKVKDEDSYAGAVTERYHCCSLCHPAQLAYTEDDMRSLSSKLSRQQQKLLPALLLSMWWRGARVSEEELEQVGKA